jgi:hypothetical protein
MTNGNPLSGELGLDTTNFKANVGIINREMRKVESEFRASAATMDDWSNSSDGLENRIDTLNQKIPLQELAIENLNKEYQQMVEAGEENTVTAKNLEIRINKYTETLGKMQKELRQSKEKQEDLGKEQEGARKKSIRLKDALKTVNKVLKKTASLTAGAARGMGNMASSAIKATARVAAGAVKMGAAVAIAVGAMAAATIGPASDLNETLSKTGVVFAEMSDQVIANAKKAASTLGVSQTAYMEYASSIGAALTAGGMGIEDATALSERAVQHFADLASFHNSEVEDVSASWQSAIRNSYEPIQKYFPFITAEYLKTYGIAQGLIGANTESLTANERAIILNAIALDENLNPALNDFSETSSGLANLNRTLGGIFTNIRAQVGGAIVPLLETAGEALKEFLLSDKAQAGIAMLTEGLSSLTQTLSYLLFSFTEGDSLNDMLLDVPESIRGVIQSIGEMLAGDVDFDLGSIIGKLMGGALARKDKIISLGLDILTSLVDGITQSLPQLLPAALNILNKLIEFIITGLPPLLSAAATILVTLVEGIAAALPTLIPAAIEILLTLVDTVIANLPLLVETALLLILSLATGIAEALPELVPALVEVIVKIVEILLENLPLIIEAALALIIGLTEGLIAAIPVLIPAIPVIVQAIFDALIQSLPMIFEAAARLITELAAGIVANIPAILTALGEVIATIYDSLAGASMVEMLKNIGKGIVSGVMTGITNARDWFYGQVKSFFGGMVEAAKEAIGWHSPPKMFVDIGFGSANAVGLGFTKGLPNMQSQLSAAMRSLAGDVNLGINAGVRTQTSQGLALTGTGAGGSHVTVEVKIDRVIGDKKWVEGLAPDIAHQIRPYVVREDQRRGLS